MAHFNSFPQRAALLKEYRINVIAMEGILESPKIQTDEQIIARVAMAKALEKGKAAIAEYRKSHPPAEFGLRRIQCFHETGQAGARYGLKLLKENKPETKITDAKVAVLGYGNVARGAMDEIYAHGVKSIHVLGRSQTAEERIEHWLKDVDLVVNGAELPIHLRGKTYLITNDHVKNTIPAGSVIIDLVSGSATNRSGVEAVISATFLTDPYFLQNEVTISSLWGWPMMGMNRETTEKYSKQIVDILTGHKKLLEGLDTLAPGVRRALVCCPF